MGRLVPAVALGNAFAIVCGGLLNRLGQAVPALTGNGQLVRTDDKSLQQKDNDAKAEGLGDYAIGLVVATCFFAFGSVVAKLIAMAGLDIHPYAWMIIAVAVAKVTNIIPEKYENAASVWYKFVSTNWTGALMLGIGIAYTDIHHLRTGRSPRRYRRRRRHRKTRWVLSDRSSYHSRTVHGKHGWYRRRCFTDGAHILLTSS